MGDSELTTVTISEGQLSEADLAGLRHGDGDAVHAFVSRVVRGEIAVDDTGLGDLLARWSCEQMGTAYPAGQDDPLGAALDLFHSFVRHILPTLFGEGGRADFEPVLGFEGGLKEPRTVRTFAIVRRGGGEVFTLRVPIGS